MIKVKYPVSGAVLWSDVEGVGPNVVLKQMYYRDNTGDGPQLREKSVPLLSCLLFSHCSAFAFFLITGLVLKVHSFGTSLHNLPIMPNFGIAVFSRKMAIHPILPFFFFPH